MSTLSLIGLGAAAPALVLLGASFAPTFLGAATTTTTTSVVAATSPTSFSASEFNGTCHCTCNCLPTPCSEETVVSSAAALVSAAVAGGGATEVTRRRLRGKARPAPERVHQDPRPVRPETLAAALEGLREEDTTPSSSRTSTRPPTPPGPVAGPPITRSSRLARQNGGRLSGA